MHTREAILPDAERIHELISAYSGDGTLLPRNFAEICENVDALSAAALFTYMASTSRRFDPLP
jgi:N-acetylglutamate synthase-like GNAT family acetyltransferase